MYTHTCNLSHSAVWHEPQCFTLKTCADIMNTCLYVDMCLCIYIYTCIYVFMYNRSRSAARHEPQCWLWSTLACAYCICTYMVYVYIKFWRVYIVYVAHSQWLYIYNIRTYMYIYNTYVLVQYTLYSVISCALPGLLSFAASDSTYIHTLTQTHKRIYAFIWIYSRTHKCISTVNWLIYSRTYKCIYIFTNIQMYLYIHEHTNVSIYSRTHQCVSTVNWLLFRGRYNRLLLRILRISTPRSLRIYMHKSAFKYIHVWIYIC